MRREIVEVHITNLEFFRHGKPRRRLPHEGNDSRALTYFGEAFFRDALAKTGSLRAAFHAARAALEKKERASGIVPSLPQASFGRQLEARLDGPARAANTRP